MTRRRAGGMSTATLATLAIPRSLRACLAAKHRPAAGRRLRPALVASAETPSSGGGGARQPLDAVRAIETASDEPAIGPRRRPRHAADPGQHRHDRANVRRGQGTLHLVGPLGFDLTDAQLKRAGLDYWNSVCVRVHDDWDAFHAYWRDALGAPGRLVAFSKFGARPHAEEGAYKSGDWLLFGAETTGLPVRLFC